MKNVICIDLTIFNNEQIVEIATLYNLNADVLLKNKKDGFAKLFMSSDVDRNVIAFTTKEDRNTIQYTNFYTEKLSSIKPLALVKEPKQMNVDSILDKISKYGIESISKEEKVFLDGQF